MARKEKQDWMGYFPLFAMPTMWMSQSAILMMLQKAGNLPGAFRPTDYLFSKLSSGF